MKPPVLVLHATGTNRDHDAAWACELAGAAPEIVHIRALAESPERLLDYRMLVLPGGFSFGDDLGAGKLWALTLRTQLGDVLNRFIEAGRPVLGICNGFQALVKAGFLPGDDPASAQTVTLTHNRSGHFECRWVTLEPNPESPCVFTRDLDDPVFCPVAHGEGRFVTTPRVLAGLDAANLVALRYTPTVSDADGYPGNPNGSDAHIAGICNARGNVFGLMPHPENHIVPEQHPGRFGPEQGAARDPRRVSPSGLARGEGGRVPSLLNHSGLRLFEQGIRYASQL